MNAPALAEIATADPDLAAFLKDKPQADWPPVVAVAARENPAVAVLFGIAAAPTPGDDLTETETGNARRLVKMFGHDLRFVFEAKGWYTWTGTHWEPDTRKVALARTAAVAEAIRAEALAMDARTKEEQGRQEHLLKWGTRSLSHSVRTNTLTLAAAEPGQAGTPSSPEE